MGACKRAEAEKEQGRACAEREPVNNSGWFVGNIRRPFLETLKHTDKECRRTWLCCGGSESDAPSEQYSKSGTASAKAGDLEANLRRRKRDSPRWRGLVALLAACVFSLCGSCIMWTTDAFHNFVANQMVLDENKGTFAWWVTPPVNPMFRVYIWNYSNWEEFQQDPSLKLKLDEIGPFAYKEIISREDIKFDDKGLTIAYKEARKYEYTPEKSGGDLNATVVVPNLPFFGAKAKLDLLWGPVSMVLKTLRMDSPLVTLKAQDFIWGYDDELFRMSKLLPSDNVAMDRVGLLNGKLRPDDITILTGASDIDKLSYIVRYNKKANLNAWPEASCNSFEGSDGSLFPPRTIRARQPVYAFKPEACRLVKFVHDKNVMAQGIRAARYIVDRNAFNSPRTFKDNLCFCNKTDLNECAADGLFDTSPCTGAPTFISYPHFYLTDPAVAAPFEGMTPNAEEHDMSADIHPRLGMTLQGRSRLQLNVMVTKDLPHLRKGMVLPVAWFAEDLPPYETGFKVMILVASYLLDAIELVLLYVLPFVALVTAVVIVRRLLLLRRAGTALCAADDRGAYERPVSYEDEAADKTYCS
ncbi:platelet glycoprotein 4-like [Frankliniella occidentalis]|uniref:Scavenger receptor class B member 1 n=1 Tax=Frankliniella occidentalis TaxID=133901 RepID=A0A6J1SP44_FRAOC|nr:platelet glycoprotein 4-like isoform X2 [Frankliniella occidentalis]XP_052132368.1 platelet glycoprotein 4-like [Frankliniella occidentalis]